MKIIVTGSLGNISKPLTKELVEKGHAVTVISSNPKKRADIEAMGAAASIGSLEDAEFLTNAFAGADAVYCMIPMSFAESDQAGYMHKVANNYLQAIKQNEIRRVVILSGWAADLVGEEKVEGVFSELKDVSVTYLRPAYFYSNFYSSMDMIKGKGLIGKFLTFRYSGLKALLTGKIGLLLGNFGGDDKIVFVSPKDIAQAATEELLGNTEGTKIRYVGSEEMTCNEAAKIIGTAIGKPWLKWVLIPDEEMRRGLRAAKLPEQLAKSLVKMQAAMHSGVPLRNFHKNNPPMGKEKLKDFAKEFAEAYYKNS